MSNRITTARPSAGGNHSIATESERDPPKDLAAEISLLGSCLHEPQWIGDVSSLVSHESFFKDEHQIIFHTMQRCMERGAIDAVVLHSALKDDGTLDAVGGMEYIGTILQSVPVSAHAMHYAERVRRCWIRRRAIAASMDTLKELYDPGDEFEILDRASSRLYAIAEKTASTKAAHFSEIADDVRSDGIATPWYMWNDHRLLVPKELTVIGARPSAGKTSMACGIIEHMVCELKIPAALFSMEMSRELIRRRMISMRAQVNSDSVFSPTCPTDCAERVSRAVADLTSAPLFIDDSPGLTVLQLRSKARELCRRHDVKLIAIDYLGMMKMPSAERQDIRVGEAAKSIKALANELNIPVVLLVQLNRAPAKDQRPPRINDLRDSGDIEAAADVIVLIHRPNIATEGEPETLDSKAMIGFSKNRNGPQGAFSLTYLPYCTRFVSQIPDGV